MRTIVQRAGVAAVCAVSAIAFTASAASAGEITGNGRYITGVDAPLHGNSICAFSGQNDAFHDPSQAEPGNPTDVLTRVQSYGQIVRTGAVIPDFLHPGSACNGHTGFLATGGGEG